MDTLSSKTPYMPELVIDWLESNLNKKMRVFEWGSGGSTLFIANRVKSIVSIEYGKRWYVKLVWHLFKNRILNCHIKLVLPDKISQEEYRSSDKYGHLTFKKFVEAIDSYPDDYFDLIIIDGRVRLKCLEHAKTKVKHGGYILFDDADRYGLKTHIDRAALFQKLPTSKFSVLI